MKADGYSKNIAKCLGVSRVTVRRYLADKPAALKFGPGLPDPGRVRCPMQAHPPPRDLRYQLNQKHNNPALKSGGLSIGDSPGPVLQHRLVA